jgi:hypothetical protein
VDVDCTASGRRAELPLAEGILAFTGSILPQLIASLSFSSLLLSRPIQQDFGAAYGFYRGA